MGDPDDHRTLTTAVVAVGFLGAPGIHDSDRKPEPLARLDQLELQRVSVQARLESVQPAGLHADERGPGAWLRTTDYEYSPNMNDVFGSTLVPMAFPFWTNGCIDSEEGLYYESSTSTPFHFLDQAEISLDPSNPVVGIPYQGLNVADGVRHLQLTGTKYFLANSPQVEQAAGADSELTEVASMPASANVIETTPGTTAAAKSGLWVLYELKDSPIVTPLVYQPVVETGMSKEGWQTTAINWYQTPADWPVPIATSGPASWSVSPPGDVDQANGRDLGRLDQRQRRRDDRFDRVL